MSQHESHPHLVLRHITPLSSRVVKGMSGLLSDSGGEFGPFLDCEEIVAVPFESVQRKQALSQAEGELGVLLICGRNHRVPLRFQ